MSNLQAKLTFLRDCLEAESRSQTLWNVRTSKSELLKPLDMPRVRGNLAEIPIDHAYAGSLAKILDRYSREKRLMMGRYFIVANHNIGSFAGKKRLRKICCPLIYFPCDLPNKKVNGKPVVSPRLDRGVVNPAALQFFSYYKADVGDVLEKLLEQVTLPLSDENRPWESINKLTSLLKSPELWVQPANSNVDTTNTATCLKTLNNDPKTVHFIDEALLYISRKQASAQGSLYEIEKIIKSYQLSPPLAAILGTYTAPIKNTVKTPFWRRIFKKRDELSLPLPVVLSDTQSNVIANAADHNLSVTVGPPGTGKSFTIASLALKEFTKGNSVLVVSQNQHAVDVVRRKLVDDFGIDPELTVLGNDEGLSRDAQQQMVDFCNGFKTVKDKKNSKAAPAFNDSEYYDAIKKLDQMIFDRRAYERSFLMSCDKHIDKKIEAVKKNFFSWLVSNEAKPVDSDLLLSEQFGDLEERDNDINVLTAKLVNLHYQKKSKKIRNNRSALFSLRYFAKSLTARSGYHQEKYYQSIDFSHVLDAVPFWFSPLSSLHRLLPLKKELFDIVIIDEATQCNLSVCLPALYRAKRAVVVGDPKQLNHMSFVSYEAQQAMFDRYALNDNELSSDFRNNSVLDYALVAVDSSSASVQLDEHFRSHPQIIEYSNQEFYDDSLKVMTTRPNRIKKVINLKRVDGKRLKGINKVEAEAVVAHVKELIEQQKALPESDVQTLGVLSFFSDQAQYIEKVLFDVLSLNELRRHNLRVGTPFSFQGEERDHMVISCCVDASTTSASYTYLNRDDVFNVAITRARDFQTIFLSCEPDEIKSNSKLKSYIKYCQQGLLNAEGTELKNRDAFQDEIYTWLQGQNITAYRNYIVAGISIDLMAVYEDRALAIDLVGFDGDLKGSLSLKQFKLLARAGLKSFLLPYDEWRNDRERLLEYLLLQLGALTKIERQEQQGVGVFNDADENFILKLTDGISINQLNARFVRSNESRAAKQITTLLQRRDRFEQLLHLCFTPQELTFKRYKNAFHNLLKDCIIKLKQASIASELATSLLEQQKQLFGKPNQYGDEYDDIFAARSSMVEEQKNKIKQLLNINEAALLQMDKTCIKLNRLYESSDDSKLSSHDILDELTEKIDLYKGVTLSKNQHTN